MLHKRHYAPSKSEYDSLPPALQRKCFSTTERLQYTAPPVQVVNEPKPTYSRSASVLSRRFIPRGPVAKLRKKHGHSRDSVEYATSSPAKEINESFLPGSAWTIANATRENDLWFSNLPDKVKRAYFSVEEERVLRAAKRRPVLDPLDADLDDLEEDLDSEPAEEDLHPVPTVVSEQSLPSLQELSTGPSSPNYSTAFSLFTNSDDEEDNQVEENQEDQVENQVEDQIEDDEEEEEDDDAMDDELMRTFDWVNENVDLSLDDYHKILTQSRNPNLYRSRASSIYSMRSSLPSLRKPRPSPIITTRSLQDEPRLPTISKPNPKQKLSEWGSGWAPIPIPPVPEIPETAIIQMIHCRKASIVSLPARKSTSTSRPSTAVGRTPAPSIKEEKCTAREFVEKRAAMSAPDLVKALPVPPEEPLPTLSAHHYLDPEARLKLRTYLASPSKFDEVLTHGFPARSSMEKRETSSLKSGRYPSARKTSQEAESTPTSPSIATTCIPDSPIAASPTTVELPSEPEFRPMPYNSLQERRPEIPSHVQTQVEKLEREPFNSASGREMTIRMTLTRPDLRADDSVLYPQNQPPLRRKPIVTHTDTDHSLRFEMLRLDESTNPPSPQPSSTTRSLSLRRLWRKS